MRWLLPLCLVLAACAPFQLHPRSSGPRPTVSTLTPDCQRTAKLYLVFGSIAAASSFLAGAGGITAAKTSEGVQEGMGYAAIGVGTIGAAATFLAGYYASAWTKCQ